MLPSASAIWNTPRTCARVNPLCCHSFGMVVVAQDKPMHARTQSYGWPRQGVLLALLVLACAWLPLQAATPASVESAANPPIQVARVSWLAGHVSLLPAGASQWQSVDLNRPLVSGDELATAADARVELQWGSAVAHLDGNTDFSLLTLNEWATQLALTQGTAELDVDTLPDGEYVELDTPQIAVVVDRAARVRVDIGTGAASTVTVRRGTVVVYGAHGAQKVLHAGERYRFASPVLGEAVALTYGSGDAFDRWAQAREMLYAQAGGGQYVAPGTVGYRDLDRYGEWRSEPDYGEVWFPDDVAAGWVPYRNGRWVWIAPWGMTWISNEPWGFAPFHYGRWAMIGNRWGWLPGVVGVRAVYAPALVGFFGGNGWHVSVGVSIGVGDLVGWYPLGPGVVYNPWYAVDWAYYARINRCDIRARQWRHDRRIRKAYDTWRKPRRLRRLLPLDEAPHGITVVARKSLVAGHDVGRARLRVAASHLRTAPVRLRGLRVKPHPIRAAAWHPGHNAPARGKPVVALHLPSSPHHAAPHRANVHASPRIRQVRLLTADTRRWQRPAHRPLAPRLFHDPAPHAGRPVPRHGDRAPASPPATVAPPRRIAHEALTPSARESKPKPAPVRRQRRQGASLPQVLRLDVPSRAYAAGSDSLPHVTRLREARSTPTRAPARRAGPLPPVGPRTWDAAPRARRTHDAPVRRMSAPRPVRVRPATPTRWHPAPVPRTNHAAHVYSAPMHVTPHATPHATSHRSSSGTHGGGKRGSDTPPAIRIH